MLRWALILRQGVGSEVGKEEVVGLFGVDKATKNAYTTLQSQRDIQLTH